MTNASAPLRLGVLFSGAGSTLANLIDRIAGGRLRGVQIVTTISSRRAVRGVEIARAAGLPVEIVRTREHPEIEDFADAIARPLRAAAVDLVVMAGFLCYWRYPPEFDRRILNIHPSLLPRFGGKGLFGHHVHEAVLTAGDRESGCSVHIVDHQYDHGAILAQARVPVQPDDSADSLAGRIGMAERELYPAVIQKIVDDGNLPIDPRQFAGWSPRHPLPGTAAEPVSSAAARR
jgi:phosphoribosylglycinamide formyltransferase 1